MKKFLAVLSAVLLMALCACSPLPEADAVRAWKKADWIAATEQERLAALTAVIAADREDIDAKRSAELSLEDFDAFFASLEDENFTLGDVYDSCSIM